MPFDEKWAKADYGSIVRIRQSFVDLANDCEATHDAEILEIAAQEIEDLDDVIRQHPSNPTNQQ
jgi:hypothetical protein